MPQEDAVLRFEIVEGLSPDAENMTRAIDAWVDTIKAALRTVDPSAEARVELVGVEAGSQVFRFALRKMLDASKRIDAAAADYPLIAKVAGTLGAAIVGGTVAVVMQPDARIPADQMKVFEQIRDDVRKSVEVQLKRERFYETLNTEPAIAEIEVQKGGTREKLYSVVRGEFEQGSGLWVVQQDVALQRVETRVVVWDVILIRPTAIAKPRRWTFARDGLTFSATMADPMVLKAIANRTLPIQVAEGVHMKIEVEYKEEFDGRVWIPISESFKVRRVLDPLPPLGSTPLFPAPSPP